MNVKMAFNAVSIYPLPPCLCAAVVTKNRRRLASMKKAGNEI